MGKLFMILTSADKEVHTKVSFMYGFNAFKKGWMEKVRIIFWGPVQKLLVEDQDLQKRVKNLLVAGLDIYACKGCSDLYNISEELTEIGMKVEYVGTLITSMLEEGWHQLIF
ncbi:MAG: DsrE family protein [Candidatus Heimdallarchaeota archaeon]|nr:DsrE family protein [Candidatus Heimdallarchaeota archaeon]